jgi:hypothetical protein
VIARAGAEPPTAGRSESSPPDASPPTRPSRARPNLMINWVGRMLVSEFCVHRSRARAACGPGWLLDVGLVGATVGSGGLS